MSKVENFKSEQELIGRIEQLRADGVSDEDITVFSKENLEGTSLNYTNVNFKSADGSAWDRFVSKFTSETAEERAMADLGLSEENKKDYITALQAGDILLFVSEEVQGTSQDKLGNDEEHATDHQSDDDAVGGEPHDAEYRQEETDPGLPGTDRASALSNANTASGSTLSADVNERGDVRDEEVNVNERGISNKPGTNSDGSTRQDKDVSGYGHGEPGTGTNAKRLKPNETYVTGAGRPRDGDGSGAEINEVIPNQTYDMGTADKQDEDYEGTMRAGEGQTHNQDGSGAEINEVIPNQTYGMGTADRQDEDYEGTMRAGKGQTHDAGISGGGRKSEAVKGTSAIIKETDSNEMYIEVTGSGQDTDNPGLTGSGQDNGHASGDDIIRDEDIERDARVVDEEPFEEYVTNETAERIDVSRYGYDDTANRDNIRTSSDGGNALKDEDLTRDDRAIRNKYKAGEVRDSEYTAHDPDRRNFNTK